jgi:hypothetical protein
VLPAQRAPIDEYGAMVERSVAGEMRTKWDRNLCHSVHHESEMNSAGIEPKLTARWFYRAIRRQSSPTSLRQEESGPLRASEKWLILSKHVSREPTQI